MRIHVVTVTVVSLCLLVVGCNGSFSKPQSSTTLPLPDVIPAADLPQFAKQPNEVQIADSFTDVDPSWVIGVIVNTKTGLVYGVNRCLKEDAKLKTTPQAEIAFKNFIENSAAANAAWLGFVKAQLSDKTRAEVTVTKISKVTAESTSIDEKKLQAELKKIPSYAHDWHGIIIGYVDYVVSAAYFRHSSADGSVSGYGAKIGGNWYSKYENSSAHHRIVAVWAPLTFAADVIDKAQRKSPQPTDLMKATSEAIVSGNLNVQKLQSIIRLQPD